MRRIIQFPLLTLLTTLLFSACFSPRSVVKIDADSPDIIWSYGHQIVQQETDSAAMQVYFDTYTKKDLLFDVEITNLGGKPILVKPEDIYLKCTNNEAVSLAANPEYVLLKIKIDRSRQEARQKNIAVAVGVATVATVATVIATDKGQQDYNNGNDFIFINSTVPAPTPATLLPPDPAFWEDEALRKTTLMQNFKVGGKVVVPRMDECQSLELHVPVADEAFVAKFKQIIIKP